MSSGIAVCHSLDDGSAIVHPPRALPMRKRKHADYVECCKSQNDIILDPRKSLKTNQDQSSGDIVENDGTQNSLLEGVETVKAREAKLERNRIAARDSRRRKKFMTEELQKSIRFFSLANGTLEQKNDRLSDMLIQAHAQIIEIEAKKKEAALVKQQQARAILNDLPAPPIFKAPSDGKGKESSMVPSVPTRPISAQEIGANQIYSEPVVCSSVRNAGTNNSGELSGIVVSSREKQKHSESSSGLCSHAATTVFSAAKRISSPTKKEKHRYDDVPNTVLKRLLLSKSTEDQLEKNRLAARETRRRKKIRIEELEGSISLFARTNASLKQNNEELNNILLRAQAQVAKIESEQHSNAMSSKTATTTHLTPKLAIRIPGTPTINDTTKGKKINEEFLLRKEGGEEVSIVQTIRAHPVATICEGRDLPGSKMPDPLPTIDKNCSQANGILSIEKHQCNESLGLSQHSSLAFAQHISNMEKEKENVSQSDTTTFLTSHGEAPNASIRQQGVGGREYHLEKNRVAARETRRRKKIMIEDLQGSVSFFSSTNASLKQNNEALNSILAQAQAQVAGIENGQPIDTMSSNIDCAPLTLKCAMLPPVTPAINNVIKGNEDQKKSLFQLARAQTVATQAMYESQGFPPAAARAAAHTINAGPALGLSDSLTSKATTTVATPATLIKHKIEPNRDRGSLLGNNKSLDGTSNIHEQALASNAMLSLQLGATMRIMANFQQGVESAIKAAAHAGLHINRLLTTAASINNNHQNTEAAFKMPKDVASTQQFSGFSPTRLQVAPKSG